MTQLPSFLKVRAVIVVDLPSQTPPGREQEGRRPAIAVTLPTITGVTRYLLVVIVPVTTRVGNWALQNSVLYPRLQAGVGNLTDDSIVLLDQIRAVGTRRVSRFLGTLTPEQYQPIEDGLKAMLSL